MLLCLVLERLVVTLATSLLVLRSAHGLLGQRYCYDGSLTLSGRRSSCSCTTCISSSPAAAASAAASASGLSRRVRVRHVSRLNAFNEEDSSTLLSSATQRQRRRKKNKYAEHSKVEKESADPLEALLQESERKNKELVIERQRSQRERMMRSPLSQPEIKPLPKLEFPDTQTIDVSWTCTMLFTWNCCLC